MKDAIAPKFDDYFVYFQNVIYKKDVFSYNFKKRIYLWKALWWLLMFQ